MWENSPVKSSVAPLLRALHRAYPRADCALAHRNPFELLIATILSAQCTDARVNEVTPVLFGRFPNAEALARAPLGEVETIIRSTGFFRQKALSLLATARRLVEKHRGEVPRSFEALLELRGVARKTANVVMGTAFGEATGVVVDTHVRRLSNRLGLTRESDPVKIERDLVKRLPRKDWIWYSHALISHGRAVCKAQSPRCPECVLRTLCPFPAGSARRVA